MKKKELDNMLDKIAAGIRSEQVDDGAVNDATGRVWSRLDTSSRMAGGSPPLNVAEFVDRIEGCADFQSLIPVFLSSRLSEARSLLLVDHTHECIPCRKALKQARTARVVAAVAPRRQARRSSRYNLNPVILRWGIAAVLIIGLGLVAWPLIQRYMPFGSIEATVQAAEGPVFLVERS